MIDKRINTYIEATDRMAQGQFNISLPSSPGDEIGKLGKALHRLALILEKRYNELEQINQITTSINAGLLLEEILDNVFEDFRGFIPYDRIGFALLEEHGQLLRSWWTRSDLPEIFLCKGYSAAMPGSSLQTIIKSGEPRILNDLVEYLEHNPQSTSTRLIVQEGLHASLTCPLIANNVPAGFIFFSSIHPGIYNSIHTDVFKQIAGQLSMMVGKGRLVSQLANQKEEIERSNAELRHLYELNNKFLGIAAHDLRNPLAVIQLTVELLQMPDMNLSPEEKLSFLKDITHQTHYMLDLLTDLLDVTQINTGQLKLDPLWKDAHAIITEIVQRQALLAEGKGTHVLLEEVPAGRIFADPLRLRQVLDNILSNAVKYSPPDSHVHVRSRHDSSGWRIEVQDEGPGIQTADRARLFQDFARLSARPTGGEKSTGLGLAICRRVMEAHHGQIGVESDGEHGSTFWISLPEGPSN